MQRALVPNPLRNIYGSESCTTSKGKTTCTITFKSPFQQVSLAAQLPAYARGCWLQLSEQETIAGGRGPQRSPPACVPACLQVYVGTRAAPGMLLRSFSAKACMLTRQQAVDDMKAWLNSLPSIMGGFAADDTNSRMPAGEDGTPGLTARALQLGNTVANRALAVRAQINKYGNCVCNLDGSCV